MLTKCVKCKQAQKQIYKVVEGHKLSADFCHNCYNSWFDLRDKLTNEAFREYISVSKSK